MAKRKAVTFEAFYGELYSERWPELRQALMASAGHCGLSTGLIKPYFLDHASLMPVEALELKGAGAILDLCAAPGGKALAIAGRMDPDAALIANDRSANRRGRLKKVLQEHLPPETLCRVTVSGHDASRWGLYEQECYDRVLADVPCSSERHVLQNPKYLVNWTPARTRHLAIQAYAILAAGFTALKPGGRLVYSTCALSHAENDEVAAKLLTRHSTTCRLLPATESSTPPGEATGCGRIILPDNAGGQGPIYWAVFTKVDGRRKNPPELA